LWQGVDEFAAVEGLQIGDKGFGTIAIHQASRSQLDHEHLAHGMGQAIILAGENAGDVGAVERKPGLPVVGDGMLHHPTGNLMVFEGLSDRRLLPNRITHKQFPANFP